MKDDEAPGEVERLRKELRKALEGEKAARACRDAVKELLEEEKGRVSELRTFNASLLQIIDKYLNRR